MKKAILNLAVHRLPNCKGWADSEPLIISNSLNRVEIISSINQLVLLTKSSATTLEKEKV